MGPKDLWQAIVGSDLQVSGVCPSGFLQKRPCSFHPCKQNRAGVNTGQDTSIPFKGQVWRSSFPRGIRTSTRWIPLIVGPKDLWQAIVGSDLQIVGSVRVDSYRKDPALSTRASRTEVNTGQDTSIPFKGQVWRSSFPRGIWTSTRWIPLIVGPKDLWQAIVGSDPQIVGSV